MSEGQFEKGKGRAKETVGDLTGDEEMKLEGQIDQTSGEAKSKFAEIVDRIKGLFRRGS